MNNYKIHWYDSTLQKIWLNHIRDLANKRDDDKAIRECFDIFCENLGLKLLEAGVAGYFIFKIIDEQKFFLNRIQFGM